MWILFLRGWRPGRRRRCGTANLAELRQDLPQQLHPWRQRVFVGLDRVDQEIEQRTHLLVVEVELHQSCVFDAERRRPTIA